MPKKIVRETWACDICGKEHPKKSRARKCESLGKVKRKFRKGTILQLGQSKIVILGHYYRFMAGYRQRDDMHVLYYKINRDGRETNIGQPSLLDFLNTPGCEVIKPTK